MLRRAFVGFALFGFIGSTAGCDEILVLEDPVIVTNEACEWDVTVGSATVTEGVEYKVVLAATDPDQPSSGDVCRYELVTGTSDVNLVTVNGESGELTWTPSFAFVAAYEGQETITVKVRATDGKEGGSVDQLVNLVVHNDWDEDGAADKDDADDDNDGVDDTVEVVNGTEPNNTDTDDDGSGDGDDNCPSDFNDAQTDSDADTLGDVCDPCPNDPLNDDDEDGVCHAQDNCPELSNAPADCDGVPATDPEQCDDDNDDIGNQCDICPGDTINDPDLDGKCAFDEQGAVTDNCPEVRNENQEDGDSDGTGDACDDCPADATNDADSDSICEDIDNCPGVANPVSDCDDDPTTADEQCDQDGDSEGDVCDDDDDDDGVDDDGDNCPLVANTNQDDNDGDLQGDACDDDDDDDGTNDDDDNCPMIANPNQVDLDGDGVGYQCDAIEQIPDSLHLGKAISRVVGHAAGGTLAIAFRGGETCGQAQFCERPGVLVVDSDDNKYEARYDSSDEPGTGWLDLLPPGGQLAAPFVSESGQAFFASERNGAFDLYTVSAGAATKTFGTATVLSVPTYYQGADGNVLAEMKSTLAANPALYDLETLSNSVPSVLKHSSKFVDSADSGAFQSKDFTLYFPFGTLTDSFSLFAHTASGFAAVVVQISSTATDMLQGKPEIMLVGEDPADGGVWYCWRNTASNAPPEFIKMSNGVVSAQYKLSGVTPCSTITAQRSDSGIWFFTGPGTTIAQSRLQFFNPLDSSSGLVIAGTPDSMALHFAGSETYVERIGSDGGSTFGRFNPAGGTLGALDNTEIYDAVVTTNKSGWLGYLGRDVPFSINGGVGDMVGGRYKSGTTAAVTEHVFSSGVLTVGARAWISPVGDLWAQYTAGNGELLNVYPAGAGSTPAPLGLTPVVDTGSAAGASVSFHGIGTLVSYRTSNIAGKIAVADLNGGIASLSDLADVRRVHTTFLSGVAPTTAYDNWVSYTTSDGLTTVAEFAMVGGSPGLQEQSAGIIGAPTNVELGPDGRLYFVAEQDSGFDYVAVGSAGAELMLDDAAMVTPVNREIAGRPSLHGVLFRTTAGAKFGYCNLPTGCWDASEADHQVLWGPFVDVDDNIYLVSQQSGAVATSPLHLWRNIDTPVDTPSEL